MRSINTKSDKFDAHPYARFGLKSECAPLCAHWAHFRHQVLKCASRTKEIPDEVSQACYRNGHYLTDSMCMRFEAPSHATQIQYVDAQTMRK